VRSVTPGEEKFAAAQDGDIAFTYTVKPRERTEK
jgi:hypothetical protein